MNLARCAYPNCGLTRLSTIHWTDDPNAEIAHGSHEYRAAPPPLDGLREALQLVFRQHPDDSRGHGYFNHGITVALRLLNRQANVDMTTHCQRVSPPNMGGGFCGSHHGWLGQTSKWCDLAEEPWKWAALRDEGETT